MMLFYFLGIFRDSLFPERIVWNSQQLEIMSQIDHDLTEETLGFLAPIYAIDSNGK